MEARMRGGLQGAQQVEFMLIGDYDPDTDTERLGMPVKFKIQAHIYAALLKSVHTPMGKSIVIKYTDDALKAYAEIINYYFGASTSHATVAADKLRKELKAFDVPVLSRRDKEGKDYIREFLDVISDYHRVCTK
jgi:hypothetical protein